MLDKSLSLKRNWIQSIGIPFSQITFDYFLLRTELWQSSLYLVFTNSKKVEYGSKLKHIFPRDGLCTIFGHVGWLGRQRHVLICVWRASSLSGTGKIQAKRALSTMAADQCLHAPHGLTSIKQSQASWEREKPELFLCSSNHTGSLKGVFGPNFSCRVEQLFRFLIWAKEVRAAWESRGPFLSCWTVLWGLLLGQDALFQSSSHFITERRC